MVATYRNIITDAIPLVNNTGTYLCIFIFALYVSVVKRSRELGWVFVVMIGLLLTTILGPVNSEFRYLYLFVIATPFILVSALKGKVPAKS